MKRRSFLKGALGAVAALPMYGWRGRDPEAELVESEVEALVEPALRQASADGFNDWLLDVWQERVLETYRRRETFDRALYEDAKRLMRDEDGRAMPVYLVDGKLTNRLP